MTEWINTWFNSEHVASKVMRCFFPFIFRCILWSKPEQRFPSWFTVFTTVGGTVFARLSVSWPEEIEALDSHFCQKTWDFWTSGISTFLRLVRTERWGGEERGGGARFCGPKLLRPYVHSRSQPIDVMLFGRKRARIFCPFILNRHFLCRWAWWVTFFSICLCQLLIKRKVLPNEWRSWWYFARLYGIIQIVICAIFNRRRFWILNLF